MNSVKLHPAFILSVVGLLAGLGATGCVAPSPEQSAAGEPRAGVRLWFDEDSVWGDDFTPAPAISENWIAVPRKVWVDQVGLIGTQLDGAYRAYADKLPRRAEVFMRRAAAQVRIEASRSTGDERLALEVAARELYALANALAKGSALDDEVLRTSFAHVHYALASHHAERAWHFSEQDKAQLLAAATRGAVDNLEQVWRWLEIAPRQSAEESLVKVRNLARNIETGGQLVPLLVDETLELLDNELLHAGMLIVPPVE